MLNPVLLGEAADFGIAEVMSMVTTVAPIMKVYPINIFIGIGICVLVVGLIATAIGAFKH